ncbi:polysaccharide biosynthesis protein GumE [Marinobacter sp. 1Y8]
MDTTIVDGHSAMAEASPFRAKDAMQLQSVQITLNQQRLAMLLVVATVCYQALLCLIHTHFFGVSRALVGVTEFAIMLGCLPLLLPRLLPKVVMIAALAGAMLCLLALIRGHLDIKGFRDLLIPLWFYWLGRNLGDPELADKTLKVAVLVVASFGLFELFALDTYTDLFNIFSYYVGIGNLQPITDYVRESKLQMNGIRPEDMGRTLLPWLLDNHRVSSVFLEPVSLGNFATIVAAWGLSKGPDNRKAMFFFVGAAAFLIVLADSRFALVSVGLLVFARMAFRGRALFLPALMPFVILGGLVAMGLFLDIRYSDSYIGRLMSSASSLLEFDSAILLGYDRDAWFPDQGYAYVLSTFGLVLAVALWLAYWLIKMPNDEANRFRCFVGIYIALILCISGTSLFALKSAGVLWFLMGSALRDPMTVSAKRHQMPPARRAGINVTSITPTGGQPERGSMPGKEVSI